MSIRAERIARQSRWSVAASLLFILAIAAFAALWFSRSTSGVELALSRGGAMGSFLLLWGLGAVCLALATLQAWRHRWAPALPIVPVCLCLTGAAFTGWIGFVQATPERLIRSAQSGDRAGVERCLRRGIEPDARYEVLLGFGGSQESPTALGAAAEMGQLEVVDVLLRAGADLEASDSAYRTPCEAAVAGGYLAVVERLLAAGADPMRPDSDISAVALAVASTEYRNNYPLAEMLQLLERFGANIASPALLRRAMWIDDPLAATTLIEILTADGRTLVTASELLAALFLGDEDTVLRLHPLQESEQQATDDAELLHLAARFGRAVVARHLLELGVDPSTPDAHRMTPAEHALARGHPDLAELLNSSAKRQSDR